MPELAEKAKAFAVRPIAQEWPWEVVRELAGDTREMLVEDLIQTGDQVILTSPPKAGKSYLSMELATRLAIGSGKFLLKRWAVKKARRVLYVSLEMTAPIMAARMRACEALLSADPAIAPNGKNLEFLFIGPEDISPADKDENGDDNPLLHRVRIAEAIARHAPEFIVFDTLIQLYVAEENDNKAMSNVMKGIRRLCILTSDHPETGRLAGTRIAHMILHHNKKFRGSDGNGGGVSDARGAGSIHSEVDLALTLNQQGNTSKYLLSLSARNVNPGNPVMLRHEFTPMLHFVPEEADSNPEQASLDDFARSMVLRAMRELYADIYRQAEADPPAFPTDEVEDIEYQVALVSALRNETKGGTIWRPRDAIFEEATRLVVRARQDPREERGASALPDVQLPDLKGKLTKPWTNLHAAGIVESRGATKSKAFRLNPEYAEGDTWVEPFNAARQRSLDERKESEKKPSENKSKRWGKKRRGH